VKATRAPGAQPSTRSSPKRLHVLRAQGRLPRPAGRDDRVGVRSGYSLNLDISQLTGPRNWAMAGGSNGYPAALVRRPATTGLISSIAEDGRIAAVISFSTRYLQTVPHLDGGRGGPTIQSPHYLRPPLFRRESLKTSWRDIVSRDLVFLLRSSTESSVAETSPK